MNWVHDAYRGFLWPYATFCAALGYGVSDETHWHLLRDFRWPLLFVAVVCCNVSAGKIKKANGG